MASLAASAANTIALPARSATVVRIAGLAGLCAAALVAPALLLVWMPIVLGVPHVASDLRYLVLPLPRAQVVVALAASAVLVALKAAALAAGVSLVRGEMIVVATWLVVAIALDRPIRHSHALQRHTTIRARASSAVWIAVAFAALVIVALPIQFAIVAAFAHNAIAIVAWLVVRRPDRRHALAVIAAIGAAVALLVLVGPAVASATGGDATRWLTIDRAASVMFGGVPLPTARALMIAFAFLQALHYAIWLDWIPRGSHPARDDASPCAGGSPRITYEHCYNEARRHRPVRASSRCSYEHCKYVFGVRASSRCSYEHCKYVFGGGRPSHVGRIVVAVTTAVVIGAAVVDPAWTRTTYLALATFHIYLELVVLAAMLARRIAR